MKKALVTGAAGFIGKHLVRELQSQGIDVVAVVREGSAPQGLSTSQIIQCDMENYHHLPDLIASRDIDTIYHFAWQGVSNQDARNEHIQLNNIQATLSLLDAAREMGIETFIGAGSLHEAEAMQEMAEDKIITNLGHMYKAAKTCAHFMAKAKAGAAGIRFFWPVITNTYGEGEHSGRLINTVIRKVLGGITPSLSFGEQLYDFVHIADVVHALYLIGQKGIDGTNYIIGSGAAKPLRDFLTQVGKIANEAKCGSPTPLGFGDIQGYVTFLPKEAFSVENLTRDTGYAPQVSFEEGVQRTVTWLKNNPLPL